MHPVLMKRPASMVFACCLAIAGAISNAADPPAKGSPRIDMTKIFPPGAGRSQILSDCTGCHTIAPIVLVQMTKDARERWARDHRDRVAAMTDADFRTVTDYLVKNFSPGNPIPKLPKELLDTWTSY